MKKKIFFTGISGFVGSNVSAFLKEEYEIEGIFRSSNSQKGITYDELEQEGLGNSDVLIHLAGNNHHIHRKLKDEEYFAVNTELTKRMFDHFLSSDCKVFIYMSSVKAVADEVLDVLDEDTIPSPITAYGKSKLEAERYILRKKNLQNKRVYILRPCMIHGPNNKGNLNLLYKFISKGVPYPFGKYQNERSYVSIDNLSFIIKELIQNKNIESGIYNIADDDMLSTNKLVKVIGEVKRVPVKVLKIPKKVILVLAKLGDIFWLPINTERVQKLTENYRVSNAKIKKAIGKELPLSAIEGLKKTISSF